MQILIKPIRIHRIVIAMAVETTLVRREEEEVVEDFHNFRYVLQIYAYRLWCVRFCSSQKYAYTYYTSIIIYVALKSQVTYISFSMQTISLWKQAAQFAHKILIKSSWLQYKY